MRISNNVIDLKYDFCTLEMERYRSKITNLKKNKRFYTNLKFN